MQGKGKTINCELLFLFIIHYFVILYTSYFTRVMNTNIKYSIRYQFHLLSSTCSEFLTYFYEGSFINDGLLKILIP